ncbi:MAG: hypothetical protein JWO95_1349 [Verrucomicrobiales bacterium]|nr:hypothetical protein [Verrucomicrobiales bacterium]
MSTIDQNRFDRAIARFDEENSHDPNTETVDGKPQPREVVYAKRLTSWVHKLAPNAPEALQLAARCQHICRWKIPRSSYPMDRPGYLKWRAELKNFHAAKTGAILREIGYDEEMVHKVQDLNLKKNFPKDPDCRVLEDALCLVFLEHQLADLTERFDELKLINAVQKSWIKMSPQGREEALKIPMNERALQLVAKALAGLQPKT